MHYDIIGDIHGCAKTLTALLEKLDYVLSDGIYRQPNNKVIFLGDFIDRGQYQKEVINIVRPMIQSGAALSVMGNHEFNAIAYHTYDDPTGEYLRKHSQKNKEQHQAFLDDYESDKVGYDSIISWFKTLPLWLELDGLNIVHACWDLKFINKIKENYSEPHVLTDDFFVNASDDESWEFDAIETLLKGKEVKLPNNGYFKDHKGIKRHDIRVKWWDSTVSSYKTAFVGSEKQRTHIPDDEIQGDYLIDYAHNQPPVFIGHYWMEGNPEPLADNIACLDYSVAKAGKLVAYRWGGEQKINLDNYVFVDRIEAPDK